MNWRPKARSLGALSSFVSPQFICKNRLVDFSLACLCRWREILRQNLNKDRLYSRKRREHRATKDNMVVNCGLIETSLERSRQNENCEVGNMLHCEQMNAFALYTSHRSDARERRKSSLRLK